MCTVSWLRGECGYELFCNRDEKVTRADALPPALSSRDGVRYIAPKDPDRGGTWLAVNEFGVTLCLLNGKPVLNAQCALASRGELILRIVGARSALDAIRAAGAMRLHPYAPFMLVGLERHFPACLLTWDGRNRLAILNADAYMPLASSSVAHTHACNHRRAWFHTLRHATGELNPSLLHEFHRSHGPKPSALSPCMHRADAQTVSFSHIVVSETSVQLTYTPSPPCLQAPGLTLALPRLS